MDESTIAAALFGGPTAPPPPGERGAAGMLTADAPADAAAPVPAPPPAEAGATAVFAESAAAPEISRFFDEWRPQALHEGDDARAAQMDASAPTLAATFDELGLEARDVADVMGMARQVRDQVLPDAVLETRTASALSELTAEYGPETEAALASANKLIDRVERGTPGVRAYLEATGLGSDPAFVRRVIAAARQRGL